MDPGAAQIACLVALVLLVAGLLWAEVRSSPKWSWFFKPLASVMFVAIAWFDGALGSVFGLWMLAALILCLLGDVFLIPRTRVAFLAGLGFFLAGHIAFAVAFAQRQLDAVSMTITALVTLCSGAAAFRWLWPHLEPKMRLPVTSYLLAISTMVVCAFGTQIIVLAAAATIFAISDLFVARQRFVMAGSINRLIGLPLYYGAQAALAMQADWL